MSDDHKILVLEELLKVRSRKQKELAYYQEKLLELQEKMQYIQMDIQVTNIIIGIIEEENVVDIQKYIIDRRLDHKGFDI